MTGTRLDSRIDTIQGQLEILKQQTSTLVPSATTKSLEILNRFSSDLKTLLDFPDSTGARRSPAVPLTAESTNSTQPHTESVTRSSQPEKPIREIGHQLSQPLMVIMTYAQNCVRLLKSGREADESILHALEKIVEQGEEMKRMLRDLKQSVSQEDPLQHFREVS